jgi:glycosyltransferase involved in cell wall biosynthesis
VKLAVVVQRYGQSINGGAELHARYIAEHLAHHADVEVLTTCAADYVTWRNELAPGIEQVNNVPVRRFKVKHERDPIAFGRLSERVFNQVHSIADELEWLDAEGPASGALIDHLAKHARDFDFVLFFSYRYYHAYHGIRAAADRAVLVPTAERDAAIGLSIFKPAFRSVRALMYNSPEERAMIQAIAANPEVPSAVVGIGSNVPANPQAARFRQKYNIREPFAIYVGRIDENKGCKELFEFFSAYLRAQAGKLSLVLIGHSLLPIPSDPRIRHLGFVDDTDKFDAMAAAELLIMPSYFESLSMVALEAWALGRPVLANAKCDVLKGQSIRSNAGLYYAGADEFIETLRAIERNKWLAGSLGRNGRQFFREQYDWPVIERKYLEMFDRLSKSASGAAMPALPGWLERRKEDCPPGAEVVARLAAGPSLSGESMQPRPLVTMPPMPVSQATDRRTSPDRPPAPHQRRRSGPSRGRRSGPPSAGGGR